MTRRIIAVTSMLVFAGATTLFAAEKAEKTEKTASAGDTKPKPASTGWSWGAKPAAESAPKTADKREPAAGWGKAETTPKHAPTAAPIVKPAASVSNAAVAGTKHEAPPVRVAKVAAPRGAAAHAEKSEAPAGPAMKRLVWGAGEHVAAAPHGAGSAVAPRAPAVHLLWQPEAAYIVPERPAVTPVASAPATTAVSGTGVTPAPAAAPAAPAATAGAPAQIPVAIVAAQGAKAPVPTLKRWIDLSTATLGTRYRTVTNSHDVRTVNQMQDQQAIKVRVKLDPAGHYSVNVGAFTGNSFIGGWNNTGIGTGDLFKSVYVKQLYLDAVPAPGLDFQYGSLYIARGESTEITSYDNDSYVTGMRATVKRPKALFFDEITATQGYLGDITTPSVFARADRLAETNYWQGLVAKRVGPYVTTSADVTRVADIDTLRAAIVVKPKGKQPVDLVRLETYRRLAHGTLAEATGFAFYGERSVTKRIVAGGGWADIDPLYGGLNADRFNKGRRLFVNGSVTLSPEFAVQTFYTLARNNTVSLANKTRLDVILSYNLLRTLQRTGRF